MVKTMQSMPWPILISTLALVIHNADGYSGGGGWQSAHATFYGGGDASGTMGELDLISTCMLLFFSFLLA